jgi:hypothetical protein
MMRGRKSAFGEDIAQVHAEKSKLPYHRKGGRGERVGGLVRNFLIKGIVMPTCTPRRCRLASSARGGLISWEVGGAYMMEA